MTKFSAAVLGLVLALATPALAVEMPRPQEVQRVSSPPVTITVAEPHFGDAHRSYVAYPAREVLDRVLGRGWNAPGAVIRFKALDGYASVIPAAALDGPQAFLAFAMADGSSFTVDNVLQNETNIALGPWYLVWDNIRHPELLRDGAVIWPYQVSEVEIAVQGDDRLFPAGLDPAYRAGGKLVQANCITCHKVNGYGGEKLAINLPDVARAMPRENFLRWVTAPRSVKPDTTMPGLSADWSDQQRQEAAAAIHDYLMNVPLLPGP